MEGKIKYGMFELTMGKDLQGELIGLLMQHEKPLSVISVISEDQKVEEFMKKLPNIKQGLENGQSIRCFFNKSIWRYQVNVETWRRKKEDNSFCGFNVLTKTTGVSLEDAFDKMEQKMKVILKARKSGKQTVNVEQKIIEGYRLSAEVEDQNIVGALVLIEEDKCQDMIILSDESLEFMTHLNFDSQVVPSSYEIEVEKNKKEESYDAILKVRKEDNMMRYDFEEVARKKDIEPSLALLKLAYQTEDKEMRKNIWQKIKHY